MAEYPGNRSETTAPENPPQSVVHPGVRRAALRTYLGPLIALFVIVAGLLLYYWMSDRPRERHIEVQGMTDDKTPGGHNPDSRHDTTRDELEYRGTTGTTLPAPLKGTKDAE